MGPATIDMLKFSEDAIVRTLASDDCVHARMTSEMYETLGDLTKDALGKSDALDLQWDLPSDTVVIEVEGLPYCTVVMKHDEGLLVLLGLPRLAKWEPLFKDLAGEEATLLRSKMSHPLSSRPDRLAWLVGIDLFLSLMAEPTLAVGAPPPRSERRRAAKALGREDRSKSYVYRWTPGIEVSASTGGDGDERNLPLHFVRGHWMNHRTGRVWRRHHWRGHPRYGVIRKTYEPLPPAVDA
jgi:hypothetical protein